MMNDLFLRFSWWLGRLPFAGPKDLTLSQNLILPKWTRGALNNLIIVIMALVLRHPAPVAGKILVGLAVFMESCLLSMALFLGVCCVVLAVMRRLGKTTETVPTGTGRDMIRAYGGPLGLASSLLLVTWGLLYLFDSRLHWTTLVVLLALGFCVLAGHILMLVNGFTHWLHAKRSMRNTL